MAESFSQCAFALQHLADAQHNIKSSWLPAWRVTLDNLENNVWQLKIAVPCESPQVPIHL